MPSRQLMIPPSILLLLIGTAVLLVRGAKPNAAAEPPVSYDCEDEGFFPHPKDCRKYFWCLDSGPANLGIVPHHFTCPSGLYFNTKTEACDYPNNVPCASEKKNKTVLTRSRSRKKSTSTTEAPADAIDDEIVLTTLLPQTTTEVVTTLPPVSSTASTTTSSTTKAPGRLLKDAGVGQRQRRPAQSVPSATSPTPSIQQEDNLKQLLHLVQSLGGVERIKTLVNDKDTSVNNEINHRESERLSTRQRSNSRAHQTTPPSFFSPSYETPRRQEVVTETPNVLASNPAPSNQIRHRRPQFDQSPPPASFSESSSPVTVNPFFSYADPSRGTAFDSEPATNAPAIDFRDNRNDHPARLSSTGPSERPENTHPNFYSFSYHTPGSRVSVQGQAGVPQSSPQAAPVLADDQSGPDANRPAALSLPAHSPFNDPFFAYNTPGRFGPQTTRAVATTASFTTVTEPSTSTAELPAPARSSGRESSRQRQANRSDGGFVRVRVNPGGNLRFSEPGAHQGSSGRRATRVRIANPSRINPGNLLNQPLPPAVASAPVPAPRNPRINQSSHQRANSQSGSRAVESNPPGVLYDEDRELHHINNLPDVSRTDIPVEIVTTRRPARRRPPQREHLRNRQEENPVGALVNLPPPNLQLDPSQSFPAATGHGGIGRPFPPRPQTLPPLPFTGTTRSLPRILPIAVPLVTLPTRGPPDPPAEDPANNQPSSSFSASFNHNPPDSGFRPGTVRYSNLNLPASPSSSPRPQFDDLFVTDFPFFGDNAPQTLPPSPQQRPATPMSTSTTTTTPPPAPTTEEYVAPSTRRHRQRQRRPTAATIAPFNETPRPTRRREVTTALPLEESQPPQPSGPPVEMESGLVKCTRRGVFAHPGSCGQFVVCAPASRGSLSYRSYMHHCPAEQVFVEEVGRCRPGNKEKCEVFTR